MTIGNLKQFCNLRSNSLRQRVNVKGISPEKSLQKCVFHEEKTIFSVITKLRKFIYSKILKTTWFIMCWVKPFEDLFFAKSTLSIVSFCKLSHTFKSLVVRLQLRSSEHKWNPWECALRFQSLSKVVGTLLHTKKSKRTNDSKICVKNCHFDSFSQTPMKQFFGSLGATGCLKS